VRLLGLQQAVVPSTASTEDKISAASEPACSDDEEEEDIDVVSTTSHKSHEDDTRRYLCDIYCYRILNNSSPHLPNFLFLGQ